MDNIKLTNIVKQFLFEGVTKDIIDSGKIVDHFYNLTGEDRRFNYDDFYNMFNKLFWEFYHEDSGPLLKFYNQRKLKNYIRTAILKALYKRIKGGEEEISEHIYFYNSEDYGGSPAHAREVIDFLEKLKAAAKVELKPPTE
jgi:hypothetical protein